VSFIVATGYAVPGKTASSEEFRFGQTGVSQPEPSGGYLAHPAQNKMQRRLSTVAGRRSPDWQGAAWRSCR